MPESSTYEMSAWRGSLRVNHGVGYTDHALGEEIDHTEYGASPGPVSRHAHLFAKRTGTRAIQAAMRPQNSLRPHACERQVAEGVGGADTAAESAQLDVARVLPEFALEPLGTGLGFVRA